MENDKILGKEIKNTKNKCVLTYAVVWLLGELCLTPDGVENCNGYAEKNDYFSKVFITIRYCVIMLSVI